MTEPSSLRPAPGPPPPAADPSRPAAEPSSPPSPADAMGQGRSVDRFVGLEQLPVVEHVALFDAEHGRLQRELGTIDQL